MKQGSVTVEIPHQAGMTAANTVNVKQRELVDCNAFQGSTFKHRNIPHILNHRGNHEPSKNRNQARNSCPKVQSRRALRMFPTILKGINPTTPATCRAARRPRPRRGRGRPGPTRRAGACDRHQAISASQWCVIWERAASGSGAGKGASAGLAWRDRSNSQAFYSGRKNGRKTCFWRFSKLASEGKRCTKCLCCKGFFW